MNTQKDPYWGCLGVDDVETDYQLAAGVLELPKPRFTFYDKEIQYHQPDVSGVSCTVSSATGALSDLSGVEFTLEQQKELWAEAVARGANPGSGWYIRKAVDLVRQYGSKYLGEELYTFSVALNSAEFYEALEMGYTVNCGYRGNKAYNSDRNDDAVLDGTDFGSTTYGHAVRCVKENGADVYNVIVDNYVKGSRPNIYKYKKEHLKELLSNSVFFITGYVFAFKKDFDTMNSLKNIPLWATKSVEKACAKGWQDWSDPEKEMTKEKLWYILEDLGGLEEVLKKLGGLTKIEGNVSELRAAVALDRLGLFD